VSRWDQERLEDILDAIAAIRSHLQRGDLSDGLIYDAVRVRLAHRYFDTSHSIVQGTVDHDLPKLEQAVRRLQAGARSESL